MTNKELAYAMNKHGSACFAAGKFDEAVAAFNEAIDLLPSYTDAYYNLGLALIRDSRRVDAVHTFEALLMLEPMHLGARFQLACIMMQRENFEQAIKYFDDIIKNYPEHVESMVNLATCYLRVGKTNEARGCYERARELNPNDAMVLYNLGVISAAYGRLQEAQQFYLKALRADNQLFDAHNNLAVIYLGKNDAENALLHFRAALALRPGDAALQHSVRVLTKSDNVDATPKEYIRSLFDSYAGHYDQHLMQGLHYRVPRALLKLFTEKVNHDQLTILDLGCGTGLCAELFKPLAKKIIGVDLSANMLQVAREKYLYDELVLSDANEFLQTHPEQFDLIILGDVLVYMGDVANLFASIASHLRTPGWVLLNAEISDECAYDLLPSGRFAHTRDYLDRLARENGLQVIAYEQASLRQQNERDVLGHLYLLEK